jgi:hypothetical protein
VKKDAGAHFESSVNGVPRTYRDERAIAIEAALFHKDRAPADEVKVHSRCIRDRFRGADALPPSSSRFSG